MKRIDIEPAGLLTEPDPSAAPPGAMVRADNVVFRRPGVVEPRPGLSVEEHTGASDSAPSIVSVFDGRVLVDDYDTDNAQTLDDSTGVSGADIGGTVYPVVSRGALWGPTERLAVGQTATERGDPGIMMPSFSAFPDNTLSLDTWFPNGEYVRYRFVLKIEGTDGLIMRSTPSASKLVSNTTGTTDYVEINFIWSSTMRYAPRAGDTIEVYRTRSAVSVATVGVEFQLAKEYIVTAAEVSARSITIYDDVDDDSLGAALYTNLGQSGEQSSNLPTPSATALFGDFNGFQFRGNITVSDVQLVSLQNFTSYKARDTVDVTNVNAGSPVINIPSSTLITRLHVGMAVWEDSSLWHLNGTYFPAGTRIQSIDIDSGTVTLDSNALASSGLVTTAVFGPVYGAEVNGTPCYFVGEYAKDFTGYSVLGTTVYYYELSVAGGSISNLFSALIQLSDSVFQILDTSASSASWIVYGPDSILVSGPTVCGHGVGDGLTFESIGDKSLPDYIAWSKFLEPGSWPITNRQPVGESDSQVIDIGGSDDALFIFKEDGIYELTGSAGSWSIQDMARDVVLLQRGCVASMDGVTFAWTNRGLIAVSRGGFKSLSIGKIDDILRPIASAIMEDADGTWLGAWVQVNPLYNEVLVGVPAAGAQNTSAYILCLNMQTQRWSKYYASSGLTRPQLDESTGSLVFAETGFGYVRVRRERIADGAILYYDEATTDPVNAVMEFVENGGADYALSRKWWQKVRFLMEDDSGLKQVRVSLTDDRGNSDTEYYAPRGLSTQFFYESWVHREQCFSSWLRLKLDLRGSDSGGYFSMSGYSADFEISSGGDILTEIVTPTLLTLTVDDRNIIVGTTAQFTATVTWSDGTTTDETDNVTYTPETADLTVSSTGLITGVTPATSVGATASFTAGNITVTGSESDINVYPTTVSYVGTSAGHYASTSVVFPTAPKTWMAIARIEASGTNQYLVSYGNSGGTTGFSLEMVSGTSIVANVADGAGVKVVSPSYDPTSIIGDGDYHAFFATYDGTTLRLYVDGVEVGSGTVAGTTGYTVPSGSDRLAVGGFGTSAGAANIDARIMAWSLSNTLATTTIIDDFLAEVKNRNQNPNLTGTGVDYDGKDADGTEWVTLSGGGALPIVGSPVRATEVPTWAF